MAEPAIDAVLDHLGALVAADTQNPPRAVRADHPIFRYLEARLSAAGFGCRLDDHGGGCVSLLATRGAPTLLWNFHLDTVPAVEGWSTPPHELQVVRDRAVGLGAADVKGAAACMLAAAERTASNAALLFSSDEEAGDDRCVREFVAAGLHYRGVVVAEPTGVRAVVAHRGMCAASGVFSGIAGHGSERRALVDSALHHAVRWAASALELAAEEERREVGGLQGVRFNLGTLAGGRKSNIIAERAELRFAVRPRPGEDPAALAARFHALAPDAGRVAWTAGFMGLPLPPPGQAAATALAERLGLPIGPAVDFWSEAPLFAAAGCPALVFGPGHIAEAHRAGEWVSLDELERASAHYTRILTDDRGI